MFERLHLINGKAGKVFYLYGELTSFNKPKEYSMKKDAKIYKYSEEINISVDERTQ
jgi:hypothetical protein